MKKKLLITSVCVFLILIIAFAATAFINKDDLISLDTAGTPYVSPTEHITPTQKPTEEPTPVPTDTPEPLPQYTNIVIGFAGDIIAHAKILENAYIGEDEGKLLYSFDHIFKYIKPAIEYSDFMVVNLESPLAGQDAGYTKSYYSFNFPDDIVPALQNAGVDMVLTGNNHAMDRGLDGVERTIDVLDSYNMMHTGTWKNAEEKAVPSIVDIQGIKVGIISATLFLNGHENKLDQEILDSMFCFTDESDVQSQINLCLEDDADIVIVCPHTGVEYSKYATGYTTKYGKAYIAMGANAVVSHHPHVLQQSELVQIESDDGTINEGVCFWSIGNFMTNQTTLKDDFALNVRETGIIVYINIQKDNYTGEVKILSFDYLPIWMLRRADLDPRIYAVLPAGNEIDFTSAPYDELPLTKGNLNSLSRAWDLALSQVGIDWATPLSTIPEKTEVPAQ